MTLAYIGLGSNLQDPVAQLTRALAALAALPRSRLVRCSSLYRSAPLGPVEQPDYVNAVAALETELEAPALLAQLQAIERAQGRTRAVRWGPRTLDLDLLLYNDLVLESPDLTLPHPGLPERGFVLYPLREIAPGLNIVKFGRLDDLAARVSKQGLEVVLPAPAECQGAGANAG